MNIPNLFGIQAKLKQLWVSDSDIQSINRNDGNAVNEFAKKVMLWFMSKDSNIANQVKSAAKTICADKAPEVVQAIDSNVKPL